MDQESLYTATKWSLLRHLESGSYSPQELARLTGSSVANVSHQLRLLELAGLVVSKRTPTGSKRSSRIQYSLADDSCYVISTASRFVNKKRLSLRPANRVMLKIWFFENPQLRIFCEKAFWRIEEYLPDMDALLVDMAGTQPISFYAIVDQRLPLQEIQELRHLSERRPLVITQVASEDFKNQLSGLAMAPKLSALYDPKSLFPEFK